MSGLNPHNRLTALDPPREHPPRHWRCWYCQAEGLVDELEAIACSYSYPPCEHCGGTPLCTLDCPGIAAALSDPSVHVVGG